MTPKYGMFYNGWTLYVLSQYKKSPLYSQSSIQDLITTSMDTIHNRLISTQLDSLRILESYSGSNWPADNLLGIVSITNDSIQSEWLKVLQSTSTHPSALINHVGSNKSEIRGSSQALITFFLTELGYPEIDNYFDTYKDIFIDNYTGVSLVKENENGADDMDLDSGPVVFGYGASATIMNIKTEGYLKKSSAMRTWALMNLISAPINILGQKYYILQQEPMLDLFMLWSSVEFATI